MEIAAALALMLLFFAAVFFVLIRRVWLRYRVIAIMVPFDSDAQACNFKLTEAIRSRGFREDPQQGQGRLFRPSALMRWMVGLQDISVEPSAGSGGVLVTGPAFWVLPIAKAFAGTSGRPYQGPQPVWPLLKACLRLMGVGVAVLAATGLAIYFFVPPGSNGM